MVTMKRKSQFQMMINTEDIIIYFMIGSILLLQTTSTTIEIAQLVGRTVSLNCPKSSSDGIIWRFNDYNLLYDGAGFTGDYKDRSRFVNVSAKEKRQVLKISDIKPEDAGLYKCLNSSNEIPLKSTQLTVLDSEPTCDSNIKEDGFNGPNTCGLSQDDMHFSCAVSYHGTKAPRLLWEDVKNNQILKECDGSQPNKINCTLMLKAEPEYDGSNFRCKVVTSHGEQFSCSTKAIKVHYFVIRKNDSKSSETINGKVSNLVRTNQEHRPICKLQEDNKEVAWHTTHKVGFYRCTYSYNIKNTSCSAELVDIIEPYTELSWSLKSLALVNSLFLIVYAVVSYFFLVNEKVKSTLENIHEVFVTWSKIILLYFMTLDFAVLVIILTRPTETFLHMKYAHTVALLLFSFVEAIILLLLKCKNEVSSCIVKSIVPIIPCLLALYYLVVVITATAIVINELWRSSHGTIDEWVIVFILLLTFFTCFVIVAFGAAKCCCKRNDKRLKKIQNILLDPSKAKEWAPLKHKILSELKSHGAIGDSVYKKILLENDKDKGIYMLINAIRRGREEDCGIFEMVIKETLGLPDSCIDNVEVKDPLKDIDDLRAILSEGIVKKGEEKRVKDSGMVTERTSCISTDDE